MIDLTPKSIGSVKVQPLDAAQRKLVEDATEAMRQFERDRPHRERKEREERRAKALADLAALPIEERLARIEAWIYDYRPTYVPPPRFK